MLQRGQKILKTVTLLDLDNSKKKGIKVPNFAKAEQLAGTMPPELDENGANNIN